MNVFEKISKDVKLSEYFENTADICFLSEPEEYDGKGMGIKLSIDGKVIGRSADGCDFLLLSDGTVGYINYEGFAGRIAENAEDLFSLLLNFPTFAEYLYSDCFLEENREKVMGEICMSCYEVMEGWEKSRDKAFEQLNTKAEDVWNITMKKLYVAAMKEPRFGFIFNGELSDTLFSDYSPWWL